MEALVHHLVSAVVTDPDAIHINTVDGEAVTVLELSVAPADQDRLLDDGGSLLRAIRTVLSAAAGSKKASLDLVTNDDASGSEE